ncbi:MAG: hypothetical protein KDK99_18380 [Verrucomicrobiales bacterium]|nr:hypothetical protein [Verrucomicrobiales bacterium]
MSCLGSFFRYTAICFALTGAAFAQSGQKPSRDADRFVVAADGTGDFTSVQSAITHAREHREQPVEILIKKGRYEEQVRIGRERPHIHLKGEDRDQCVIAFTSNDKLNPDWARRAVLAIEADDSVIENLTVQNTTPYQGSQAEAVYVNADRCILRGSRFLSFQDTLNLSGRVYVTDCYVEGDVDYVWGYGAAVFERCELRTMHDGYLVQARNSKDRTGYVFIDCKLTAAPETTKFYLARIESARFPFSQACFIRCSMPPQVRPEAWQITGDLVDTLRFQEYGTTDLQGAALDLSQRHGGKILSTDEVAPFTPIKILGGKDGWTPAP